MPLQHRELGSTVCEFSVPNLPSQVKLFPFKTIFVPPKKGYKKMTTFSKYIDDIHNYFKFEVCDPHSILTLTYAVMRRSY